MELGGWPTILRETLSDKITQDEPSTGQASLKSVNSGQSYLKNKQWTVGFGKFFSKILYLKLANPTGRRKSYCLGKRPWLRIYGAKRILLREEGGDQKKPSDC